MLNWKKPYNNLNLCNGKIQFLSEDDEDMIKIEYNDGMLIDVGKPLADNRYCITVVKEDTLFGWQNPLAEIYILNKQDLANKIQETITKFRGVNY